MSADKIDDPFERAVRREGVIRQRMRGPTRDRADAMRFVAVWMLALATTWAAILAGHWLLFPEPRWLIVLHTVVFALMVAMGTIAYLAQRVMVRKFIPTPNNHEDLAV